MDSLSDYDFTLPDELIARQPADRRDQSRLLRLGRETGELSHHVFHELPQLLEPGDLLVLNDSRVIRARLRGFRTATGGGWSGLFLNATAEGRWRLLGQTRGKLTAGETLTIVRYHAPESPERLELRLVEKEAGGVWQAIPSQDILPLAALETFGTVPLPPYMHRESPTESDLERYQTTYAQHPGSVAAPTAGLHLTPELRQTLTERGIEQVFVTLHVGLGTFLPIAGDSLAEHTMHFEWCEVSQHVVDRIEATRNRGGRIIAVGTTSVRSLETAAARGKLAAYEGETNLFIRPPYEFRVVDGLITNFHLPKSTLLVLVSALAGLESVRRAYETAIAQSYRFYSFGDAMLIL